MGHAGGGALPLPSHGRQNHKGDDMRSFMLIAAMGLALSGCGARSAPRYSLYRNSGMDRTLRIHWATFDARESDPSYNEANCMMAARLLNANMRALGGAGYDPSEGFWCEPGSYEKKGGVPSSFRGNFPTDT